MIRGALRKKKPEQGSAQAKRKQTTLGSSSGANTSDPMC